MTSFSSAYNYLVMTAESGYEGNFGSRNEPKSAVFTASAHSGLIRPPILFIIAKLLGCSLSHTLAQANV